MNKIVVGWSAALLVLGVVLGFLPDFGPWLAVVTVVPAWFFLVLKGPVPVVKTVIGSPPPVETVHEVEVREVVPDRVTESVHWNRATLDVVNSLKALVVKDTEEAAVKLTGSLFTLVQNSKDVSSHIEKSLSFITNGESGLGRTVVNLEEQVRVFEALASHFDQVRSGLASDIQALTQAVGSINQFSSTLSDLADQTNVLAINASIEAARVGAHGRGFAVIANHVQGLAKHSKDISDKMALTIREVVGNVESSFERQTRRIEESERLIHRSEKELRNWADHVGPQVAEVEAMIVDSRRLAHLVTEQLGQVTVSLQFQDRTRQILDHVSAILGDVNQRLVGASGLLGSSVPATIQAAAFEEASRHFTVQEEWSQGPSRSPSSFKSVELF